jgi:MarR family transcriptional regulator, organic hydroperoxide resistance regulator
MSTRSEVISVLLQTSQRLGSEGIFFHAAASKKLGLHVSDVKALNLLLEHGPLTAGQLAGELGLTPGAVTSLVRRLQAASFVRREPGPQDRRSVTIHIEPKQIAQATELYQPTTRSMTALLENYSVKELELLIEYEQRVADIMHAEGLRLLQAE